jgi:catechol 2,3-dioxygenase-like lactoylglutathione lyase family enzyme
MQSRFRYGVSAAGLVLLAVVVGPGADAQLAEPNASGVAVGHVHFRVSDPDLHRGFWQSLGATEVTSGIPRLAVSGTYLLFNGSAPDGGSQGTSTDHVGFLTRDYAETKAALEAVDAEIAVDNAETGQMIATLPDGVRVELQACGTPTEFDECDTLSGPIAFHHFHISSPDGEAIRQWYLDMFGMEAGTRRNMPSALVPGGRVDVLPTAGARGGTRSEIAGTQGRALDHIGFEVADMAATVAHLEANGVEMDSAPRTVGGGSLTIAFLTDPDGTYIELTQGLGQ